MTVMEMDSARRHVLISFAVSNALFFASTSAFDAFLSVTAQAQFLFPLTAALLPTSVLHLGIAAADVPLGAVSDRWGRVPVAMLGIVIVSLSELAFFSQASSSVPFLYGVIAAFVVGWCLYSGSLSGEASAWLRRNDPTGLSRYLAVSSLASGIALVCAKLLYPIIYAHGGLPSVWLASAGLALAAFATLGLTRLTEARRSALSLPPEGHGVSETKSVKGVLRETGKELLKNRALLGILAIRGGYYLIRSTPTITIVQFMSLYASAGSITAGMFPSCLWALSSVASLATNLFLSSRKGKGTISHPKALVLSGASFAILFSVLTIFAWRPQVSVALVVLVSAAFFAFTAVATVFGNLSFVVFSNSIRNDHCRATLFSVESFFTEGMLGLVAFAATFILPKGSGVATLWAMTFVVAAALFLAVAVSALRNRTPVTCRFRED